jgi:hypothetical protein
MSLAAVRNLTVVSFFVIGGLLITSSLYAGTAPYTSWEWSIVNNEWGTTFDDKPGNYNKGMYFAAWVNPVTMGPEDNPNRNYGEMPQEDTFYIHEINAPFDMAQTSWSATPTDIATQYPLFATFDSSCNPQSFGGAIYAMNDTDHIYIALEIELEGVDSDDFVGLYFDPDALEPVQQFIEGSAYHVGVQLGDVTFNQGVGNTVNEEMDFCNGHWKDWDNSGSIDTWEAAYPWPRPGEFNAITYPMEKDSGDTEDLTICPRMASLWGDSGTTYPLSGAYHADCAGYYPWGPTMKSSAAMLQFKIPIEHLGCSLALGSSIGFAIELLDDMGIGSSGITPCTTEIAWFPQDIEQSGAPGPTGEWDQYDATYMGQMNISSLNLGNRLWGPWFSISGDRTSYLVLKNVGDDEVKTKVKFYQSQHGDATEIFAPLPNAGDSIFETQCIVVPGHGVSTLQLETLDIGGLQGHRGCIEITNTQISGYVVALIGLDSGSTQHYAWSVDLEVTPLTPAQWTSVNNMATTGMMLTNKWYIVGEPGWDFDTSVVLVNPSSTNSVTARLVLYPAVYWNPLIPDTMNTCADIGFHPDFDGDYSGTSPCGDITGDMGDAITIPSHQAVEIRMWDFLNQWIAPFKPSGQVYDYSEEITDPDNAYWHFRKGTVEIFVHDGDDLGNTDRLDEALLGITARESFYQGWAEKLDRYYE